MIISAFTELYFQNRAGLLNKINIIYINFKNKQFSIENIF